VRAFAGIDVATLANFADPATALLICTAASTGLRFGELASMEWVGPGRHRYRGAPARETVHPRLGTSTAAAASRLAKKLVKALWRKHLQQQSIGHRLDHRQFSPS